MANPAKTLKKILAAIDKDAARIKRTGMTSQLTPADAQTLSRYVSALSNIVEESEKIQKKNKNELNKLTMYELINQYNREKRRK